MTIAMMPDQHRRHARPALAGRRPAVRGGPPVDAAAVADLERARTAAGRAVGRASVVGRRRRRRRARGGQRPDRSRRRPCLRRRGRTAPLGARCSRRPGDSLWSIAEAHHGDVSITRYVDALIALNGGTRDRWPGQRRSRPARESASLAGSPLTYPRPVHCPVCHADDTKVVDSRLAEEGAAVRRRRHCLSCSPPLHHVRARRRGAARRASSPTAAAEPFDRAKIVAGVARRDEGPPRRAEVASSRWPRRSRTASGLQGSEVTSAPARPRRARPAAHDRRGRLPALRQRLQELRRRRRLPPRDRAAHEGGSQATDSAPAHPPAVEVAVLGRQVGEVERLERRAGAGRDPGAVAADQDR